MMLQEPAAWAWQLHLVHNRDAHIQPGNCMQAVVELNLAVVGEVEPRIHPNNIIKYTVKTAKVLIF